MPLSESLAIMETMDRIWADWDCAIRPSCRIFTVYTRKRICYN